jgi:hypothetical protein
MISDLLSAVSFTGSLKRVSQVVAFVAAVVVVQGAQAGIKSERLLASILRQTPEATLVPAGEQMKQAEAVAGTVVGAQAFWGVGSSMEPLYAPETAIVVAPVKFSELKKGMTAVYVSRQGRMVAHALTGDLPTGWIAQGINNDREDSDLVTKDNLVGIVIQAYAATNAAYRVELTKSLVAKGRLDLSTKHAD